MSNTEQRPQAYIDGGTLAASVGRATLSRAEDPRTRRFAVNPAAASLQVHPNESGRPEMLIPYGQILAFHTFEKMKTRNWSIDPTSDAPDWVEVDLAAAEQIANVRRAATEAGQDTGFRELSALTAVESDEAVREIVAAVFPPLRPGATKKFCRYEQENTVEARDGSLQVVCLTCRLKWLTSDVCEQDAEHAGPEAVLLRTQLIDGYRAARKFYAQKWSEWKSELKKRAAGEMGLSVLLDAHLFVMRQLHEIEPEREQAQAISQAQAEQGKALTEGIKEGLREAFAQSAAQQQPAPPAVDINEIKRQLLADPEVRRMLADEVAQEAEGPRKPGKAK